MRLPAVPDAAATATAPLARGLPGSPRTRAALVYGGLALVGLVAAYYALFSRFAVYDDEGSLLTPLKAFVDGDVLYDTIYTPYGPLYYEVWGSLYAIAGRPVTTDSARFIVMVVWVATSLLFGYAAQRMSGLLSLGAGATAVAFGVLIALTNEPMHPVGLVVALLAGLAVAIVTLPARRPLAAGIVIGALLAALLLTKVNVGVFATVGCAFAAAITLRSRVLVRWSLAATYAVMPIALLAAGFADVGVVDLAMLVTLAAAAVVVVAWHAPGDDADSIDGRRLLLGMFAGLGSGAVLILGAIVAAGTSLPALFDDVVGQALRQREIFSLPLRMPSGAVPWAFGGLAGALIAVLLRDGRPASTPWPGAARIVAGLAIWSCAAQIPLLGLAFSGFPNLAIPAALAWVAVLGPRGIAERPGMRFARVALPAIAVAQILQVYPVAGTQISAAAVTFVPVGAICLADGWRSLRAWSATRGELTAARTAAIGGVTVTVLALALVDLAVVRPGLQSFADYRARAPLPFAGAGRLHIERAARDTYARLAEVIALNGCTALVGLPSTNSMYLWTSIDPPSSTLPSAWMTQLDDELQQRAVDELRRSPRPCAFRHDESLPRG